MGDFFGIFKRFRNACGRLKTLLRLSHGENSGSDARDRAQDYAGKKYGGPQRPPKPSP